MGPGAGALGLCWVEALGLPGHVPEPLSPGWGWGMGGGEGAGGSEHPRAPADL